ncbi:hypothetical protein MN116_008259 [Schistosoma mekongi]|uniref:Uncharacterized protein n=1 Tax=Schistosoma mekongi TaxID=38744 RepID=A0AAE1Z6M9_SCHME|nr:hypothetical protein MN116_008259 [Schistosoma mekongi]
MSQSKSTNSSSNVNFITTNNTDLHSHDTTVNQHSDNHEQLINARLKSLAPECDSVKTSYDLCFEEFFPNFLQGHHFEKDPCESKLKIYQDCLREALKTSHNMDLTELDSIHTDAETIRNITSKTE